MLKILTTARAESSARLVSAEENVSPQTSAKSKSEPQDADDTLSGLLMRMQVEESGLSPEDEKSGTPARSSVSPEADINLEKVDADDDFELYCFL